ncbi:hypothetical protein QBC43DRAFT_123476 [Cladorrhinum sp. PSN259]|nr:hypothetical protein QBC43DRAFT_123476 [Cladorrhinum sp. PSN259]
MQFSAVFTILAMAMTTVALPTASENPVLAGRTSTTPACSNSGQNPVCCSATDTIPILIGLIPITIPVCNIAIAGSTCSGKSACCTVSGNSGDSVIDINILNGCNQIL